MTATFSVSGVSERDIDLLLLEEFVSSTDFARWFTSQVLGPATQIDKVLSANRSVTTSTGESDLEVMLAMSNGSVWCLLIENKISASFQPRQADRYSERGMTYLKQSKCSVCRTVLVAPEQFLGSANALKGFDAKVTYESLQNWFHQHKGLGNRMAYKAGLLASAIEKAVHGWQLIEDAPITAFWRSYWELANSQAPELEMEEPGPKPSTSWFVHFRPADLPSNVEIVHKMLHGNVDLQFLGKGRSLSYLRQLFGPTLSEDMTIQRAGKSGVVRMKTPVINPANSFDSERMAVLRSLDAAKKLLDLFRRHASQ